MESTSPTTLLQHVVKGQHIHTSLMSLHFFLPNPFFKCQSTHKKNALQALQHVFLTHPHVRRRNDHTEEKKKEKEEVSHLSVIDTHFLHSPMLNNRNSCLENAVYLY